MKLRRLIKKFEKLARLDEFSGSLDSESRDAATKDYKQVAKELSNRLKEINRCVSEYEKQIQKLDQLI